MDEDNGGWVGLAIGALVVWGLISLFSGSGSSDDYSDAYSSGYSGSSSYVDCSYYEPKNPYYSDSGHSAGFDWAERTGGYCSGNSDSFNEGCEEYYAQEEAYDSCLSNY